MKNWLNELDKFTAMYGQGTLTNAGIVSHGQAIKKAEEEYRKYQVKTLSPVENAYLDTIRQLEQKVKDKKKKE